MINKILKLSIIILIFATNIYALNNKLALEIARTNKIESTIDNVKDIYNYINLYILDYASKPDASTLLSAYPNINFDAYLSGKTFSFTISDNVVKFQGLIDNSLSNNLNAVYVNLVNTKLNASLDASNNILMNLDFKSVKFLRQIEILKDVDTNNRININKIEPSSASYGDMWYRPDANGGFYIYFYTSTSTWEYVSNNINLYIYKSTKDDLDKIKAPKGTKGYANILNSATEVNEYISNGTSWLKASY